MKFKQMDFAMETCLQFYILTTLREKVLIYNLGETIFMIFSQAIQAMHVSSSVGKYPYRFRKGFALSFLHFDQNYSVNGNVTDDW